MTIKDFVLSALGLFIIPVTSMAIEEPEYKVVGHYADFELRLYAPYIVAEVDVRGNFDSAGSEAFRILAGYIFGDNAAAEKMAMTAPVEARATTEGEKMAMTAPVTTTAAEDSGEYTYAFVMERKYSLQSLPVPNDERIRIRQVPARTMAAHRYSGRWTEEEYLRHKDLLLTELRAQGIQTVGQPILARYNSPFSLPFLRRNEVLVEIIPATSPGEVPAQ